MLADVRKGVSMVKKLSIPDSNSKWSALCTCAYQLGTCCRLASGKPSSSLEASFGDNTPSVDEQENWSLRLSEDLSLSVKEEYTKGSTHTLLIGHFRIVLVETG